MLARNGMRRCETKFIRNIWLPFNDAGTELFSTQTSPNSREALVWSACCKHLVKAKERTDTPCLYTVDGAHATGKPWLLAARHICELMLFGSCSC